MGQNAGVTQNAPDFSPTATVPTMISIITVFSGEIDFDANGDVTKAFYYIHTYDDMGGRPDPVLVDLEGNPADECGADG